MDDFIWPHRDRDCRDLFWRATVSSSTVCAGRPFGKDNAILGSAPQRVGIPRSDDPAGLWNRLGPEQEISNRGSLDWRIHDRRHSISLSAYFDPRPRRISA